MAKVSRSTAEVEDAGIVENRHAELEGYTVNFITMHEDVDQTPLLRGLPDDQCQCPHWGYIVKGKMTVRYGDHEEIYEAGDALYMPPGHVPIQNDPGTEFLMFSPTEEARKTDEARKTNLQALQAG